MKQQKKKVIMRARTESFIEMKLQQSFLTEKALHVSLSLNKKNAMRKRVHGREVYREIFVR